MSAFKQLIRAIGETINAHEGAEFISHRLGTDTYLAHVDLDGKEYLVSVMPTDLEDEADDE